MFYIAKTDDAKDLPLPQYMSKAAAGLDLYANIHEAILLKKGEYRLIPTGIKIAMPEDFEAEIRPRSGLALKHGITLLNAPGTIDADYRGEIKVILINFGDEDYVVNRGERIAQMVISRYERVEFQLCEELGDTERGEGGFGHSGK